MSFIEAYYNFSIDLTYVERSLYSKLRFKLAKHPDEMPEHVLVRALAYLHSYTEDLQFTAGYFEPEKPSLLARNELEEIITWIDIGESNSKRLKLAKKHCPLTKQAIYFYRPEQVDKFCKELRGSTENWISRLDFYLFDAAKLSNLLTTLEFKNNWSAVIQDNEFYITVGHIEVQLSLELLSLWDYYQSTIGNAALK